MSFRIVSCESVRQLRHATLSVCLTAGMLLGAAFACAESPVTEAPRGGSPRIYIEPQNGFESYLSAAIVKKHVPAVVTTSKEGSIFVLTSVVVSKEESTGSKVARCLFLYCAGAAGIQTATVQLINGNTQEVAWAYNVQKASASAYQSTAEAVAKHLKEFLEKHPQ